MRVDPRTFLDDDLDAGAGQPTGHIGNDGHPVLAGARFGRDGEFHGGLSEHGRGATGSLAAPAQVPRRDTTARRAQPVDVAAAGRRPPPAGLGQGVGGARGAAASARRRAAAAGAGPPRRRFEDVAGEGEQRARLACMAERVGQHRGAGVARRSPGRVAPTSRRMATCSAVAMPFAHLVIVAVRAVEHRPVDKKAWVMPRTARARR